MITTTEFYTLGTGFTVLILAYVLLRSPTRPVQFSRLFAAVCAGASVVLTLVAFVVRLWEDGKFPRVDTSPALAAVSGILPVVLLLAIGGGALWLMRGRLRPKGFQKRVTVVGGSWVAASNAKSSGRYAKYRKVQP